MRRRIVAGNWKMHKTAVEAVSYMRAFLPLPMPAGVNVVICAPFTALAALHAHLGDGSRARLGAQNVHWESSGAFTGEISAPMLREFGVTHAIVGHSERRQYFGESDELVRRRTAAALAHEIVPIVAVGETLEIREAGDAVAHVTAQTRAALQGLPEEQIAKVVLAYEPVWSIGTGRNCDPAEANAVMGEIRRSRSALADVPILYGGSVKPENVAQYIAQPEIDGALVGGASLDPGGFALLIGNIASA